MREELRGFAAAVLGQAREAGTLDRVRGELEVLAQVVLGNEALYDALTDGAIPATSRRAVVEDLLGQADRATALLAGEVIAEETAGEVPPILEWLVARAQAEQEAAEGRAESSPDPPAGRSVLRQRLDGFATALFRDLGDRSEIDEVEDELFRFARTVEATAELRTALTGPDLPLVVREGVVRDLLADRARPATLRLASYALASSRGRGLVSLLDWLVERAAAERGLRVADVRAAVDLDEDQRARLTAGLSRLIGRQVEVRVTVDPAVIGGVRILLGNTVIDGTVQHRLDQLRARLARGPAPGSRTGAATSVSGGAPRPAGDGHVTGEPDGGRGTDGSD